MLSNLKHPPLRHIVVVDFSDDSEEDDNDDNAQSR
jgi:hypothetical protein